MISKSISDIWRKTHLILSSDIRHLRIGANHIFIVAKALETRKVKFL